MHCPFSRITAVVSPLGPMICLDIVSWFEIGPTYNQNAVGYFCNIHFTVFSSEYAFYGQLLL